MPSFSFDDIREAAERKFGPYTITGLEGGDVTLVNYLQLDKSKRDKIDGLDDDAEKSADDRLTEVIRLAAKTPADSKRLLAAAGNNLALLRSVIDGWTEASQVGEAQPSSS